MKQLLSITFSLILLLGSTAHAETLLSLMKKGPVITLDLKKNGKFKSATARIVFFAPFKICWDTVIDLNHYKDFAPAVVSSKIIKKTEKIIVVKFEIEVPGINTKYYLKYILNKKKKRIDIYQTKGAIKGSHYHWYFFPKGNRTIIKYIGTTKNFNAILEGLEDKKQTITLGINVSAVTALVKAIRAQAELNYKKQLMSKNNGTAVK